MLCPLTRFLLLQQTAQAFGQLSRRERHDQLYWPFPAIGVPVLLPLQHDDHRFLSKLPVQMLCCHVTQPWPTQNQSSAPLPDSADDSGARAVCLAYWQACRLKRTGNSLASLPADESRVDIQHNGMLL